VVACAERTHCRRLADLPRDRSANHMSALGTIVRSAATRALDLALPAACVGCHAEGPPICDRCVVALDARLTSPAGVPIGLPGEIPEPLLQLDWCASFHGVVRDALHAMKYQGEQRLATPLGGAVARRWARIGVGAEIITHVPVPADRAKRRGYDQAELIASAAASALGLPHLPLLARQRATIAQFDLDRRRRATNVRGAFVMHRRAPPITGRWILLVDDVTTTGATLAACADALCDAGALGVSAITVARER
jgi:predicted amidophosphoribosyltransferase